MTNIDHLAVDFFDALIERELPTLLPFFPGLSRQRVKDSFICLGMNAYLLAQKTISEFTEGKRYQLSVAQRPGGLCLQVMFPPTKTAGRLHLEYLWHATVFQNQTLRPAIQDVVSANAALPLSGTGDQNTLYAAAMRLLQTPEFQTRIKRLAHHPVLLVDTTLTGRVHGTAAVVTAVERQLDELYGPAEEPLEIQINTPGPQA